MTALFTAKQIVEAGISKERRRMNFYSTIADKSESIEIKSLFNTLSKDEEQHIYIFSEIGSKIDDDSPHPPGYDEEMYNYMEAILDDKISGDQDFNELVFKLIDTNELFKTAINLEKDSILYFREFLPFISDNDKDVIYKLIDEEKKHIRELVNLRNKMR